MQKKEQITNQEAKEWISKNQSQIIVTTDWRRSKYLEKLGISPDQNKESYQKQKAFQNDTYQINFLVKSSDKIRERYLNKLALNGIIKQQPRKKHQNVFIFDWDDTILCTSYLSAFQFLDISSQAKVLLKKIDSIAQSLLKKCLEKGQVYIITNAAKGWVQYSSKIYLQNTYQLLSNSSIVIISARSKFGQQYPGQYGKWKQQAFKSIIQNFDVDLVTNLICLGDSNIQMQAAQILVKQFTQGLVKTVKFKENPKPDELIKQQQLVLQRLKEIFAAPKNLTIRLQRKAQKN